MGLDMYLTGKVYLSDYTEDEKTVEAREALKDLKILNGFKAKQIEVEVMYWRKANAIHQWFVNNIQEGEDNCQTYYVTHSDLHDLLKIIDTILKTENKEKQGELIDELLPPQSGFFFGSNEIDEWYFEDLKATQNTLTNFLNIEENKRFELYYHSSW